MKKLFLAGRSEAGKTSLTQALKGEPIHYVKTQYVKTDEDIIDTPGEYAESKRISHALGCFSYDADILATVCAADEPYNLTGPCIAGMMSRPMIGVITRIDAPGANVPMVRQWLIDAGCEPIFMVNNFTGEGVQELLDYLEEPVEIIDVDVAMGRQQYGQRDWYDGPRNVRTVEEEMSIEYKGAEERSHGVSPEKAMEIEDRILTQHKEWRKGMPLVNPRNKKGS
ncbi:MAG: ethanolamine utilization protein EutP [Lachnospiraceae bacterium]|nr:ethanolamine utilization protein EutP [Lachnospiraceae bacterium]